MLEDAPAPASGRVTAVPDKRTIRYYTTLGLLDAPAEMRGRTAYYGRRHLLQLVAIKRLQADGIKLSQVQQRLSGQPDGVLAQLARLPDVLPAATPAARAADAEAEGGASAAARARRRESFWGEAVAALPAIAPEGIEPEGIEPEASEPEASETAMRDEGRAPPSESAAGEVQSLAQAQSMLQITLEHGAVLMVPIGPRGFVGTREMFADDLAALRRAASPLLEELARRGLVQGRKS
ncbi:MAG: MerR family transcriptional regulator [Myxococcales bacterium]|nr:MerR family transcriptional regulator [Myxococcales bacterium]